MGGWAGQAANGHWHRLVLQGKRRGIRPKASLRRPYAGERHWEARRATMVLREGALHILVTNDDGVRSPGLLCLKQALEKVAKVTVFAPERNWSAAGHNRTMHKPLRVDEVSLADGSMAYASNGTPSDCVALALLGLVPERVDMVFSGINMGANLGQDITYSGTVAGAMEAAIYGLPAISISLCSFDPAADFRAAGRIAAALAQTVFAEGLPKGVFLNVNVPALPLAALQGVQLTRLGRRVYKDVLLRREDPRGRPYYWIGGDAPGGELEPGTDVWAVEEGYISVTPIHMDMTAYHVLEQQARWAALLTKAVLACQEEAC